MNMNLIRNGFWEVILSLGLLFIAIALGILIYFILFKILSKWVKRTAIDIDDLIVIYLKSPLRFLFPLVLVMLVIPSLTIPDAFMSLIRHILSLLFIGCLAWILISIVAILKNLIFRRYDITVKDNLKARMVHTQIEVIERILIAIISIIALSTMLITFERVRQVGESILASATIESICSFRDDIPASYISPSNFMIAF